MILKQAQEILQRILDPLPLNTFLDDVLGKKFIHLEGKANPHQRDTLLGDDPEQSFLGDFARLAPIVTYHAAVPLGPPPVIEAVANAAAFKAKIATFHARGYTVRLPDIRALTPQLDAFIRAMELVFHTPAKVESFWSRNDAKAPVHHDDYDIIVIQIRGRKRWFISTDESALPNDWKQIPEGPPRLDRSAEIIVEPGDMLYLPRGTTHRVDAMADSIHISIGFVPLTLREAIIACLDHVSDLDRPLREPVGRHLGEQVAAGDFGDLPLRIRQGLATLLQNSKADAFIADALQRRSSRAIAGLDKLREPVKHAPLSPATRLRHSATAVSHLSGNARTIDFAYPGGHHYIHRGAEQGVYFMAATPEFRIRDIPGNLGDEVRIALAEKLVASGFLEVVEDH